MAGLRRRVDEDRGCPQQCHQLVVGEVRQDCRIRDWLGLAPEDHMWQVTKVPLDAVIHVAVVAANGNAWTQEDSLPGVAPPGVTMAVYPIRKRDFGDLQH